MKNFYKLSAMALSLCATGAMAGVGFAGFDMASVKSALSASETTSVANFTSTPSLEQLKAFAAQTRAEEATDTELPKGVTVETVLDKSFTDMTAGSLENPDGASVGEGELYDQFFGANSDWTIFQCYQAGGNMYLGYDETGDNGPGYFMTPGYDFTDPKVAYRLRVTAMNVNPNAQEQPLQAFFMKQEPGSGKGQMVAASAVPMSYNEWSVCEWVGKVKADAPYVRAMILGWQGKVMVKNVTFEKLIYPVASVADVSISYEGGKLTAKWEAVEGAVSYQATAYMVAGDEQVELGDVTSTEPNVAFDAPLNESADRYYVTVVACNEAGEESYPVSGYAEIQPDAVGDATALPASNVSEKGFTANWEAIADAGRTLVYPVQSHKAVSSQTYDLLTEDFSNVPESNDMYNPAQIIPMMGMGNIDLMMSRAGWSTDICFFFRLSPEMPALALSNMFAAYGMPGYLLSPVYDLSVGGGKVYISGMALSGADDAVVTFFLVDADTMEPYASKEVEVNPYGVMVDIDIEGGKPNSRIMFYMTDCAEEEMIVIPSLSISVDMNEGDEITAPLPTEFVAAPATSFDFEYPVDANNSYSYTVQGVFKELVGAISEAIEVTADGNGVATAIAGKGVASLKGGVLTVENPDAELVTVMTLDGKVLAVSNDARISLDIDAKTVIVKVGTKAFKFVK